MFEHSAIGIALTDGSGRFVQVNAKWCEMIRYTESEVLALTFGDVTHPDDVAGNLTLRDRFFAGEISSHRLQKRYLRKSGERISVDLTAAVTGDADEHGRPLHVVSQMLDVTDRLRGAVAALRASEAELRAVLAAITDVVLVLDADGRYVKIAATSPELLYRPPEILLGRTLREVFPAERAAEFERVVRHSIASGERVPFEYAVEIAGERRWFTGSASPMQGLPLVVWVARDVTAERGARSAASFARSAPLCR